MRIIRVPPPPEDLNEREKVAWRTHATQVDPLQIYTGADWSTFRTWARMTALLEDALDGERAEVGRDGEEKLPALTAIAALSRVVTALAAKFRCDPLSRGAVPATAEPPQAAGVDLDDLRPLGPGPVPENRH